MMEKNKGSMTIIGGDFNLPDIKWSSHAIVGNQNLKSTNEEFLHNDQEPWSDPNSGLVDRRSFAFALQIYYDS